MPNVEIAARLDGLDITVRHDGRDESTNLQDYAWAVISYLRRNVRGVARMMDETKYVESGLDPVPPMEDVPSLWTWTVPMPEQGGCTPAPTTGKAQSKAKPKKGGK